MMDTLAQIRCLVADIKPLVVAPLVIGEPAALIRLLLRLLDQLMEEVVKGHPSYVSIGDLEIELARWHTKRYGTRPIDMAATLQKLHEEQTEFLVAIVKAIANKDEESKRAAAEEAVDMIFVLHHLIRGLGVSLPWAIIQKFEVIERRITEPDYGRKEPKALPCKPAVSPAWYDGVKAKAIGHSDLGGPHSSHNQPDTGSPLPEVVDPPSQPDQA